MKDKISYQILRTFAENADPEEFNDFAGEFSESPMGHLMDQTNRFVQSVNNGAFMNSDRLIDVVDFIAEMDEFLQQYVNCNPDKDSVRYYFYFLHFTEQLNALYKKLLSPYKELHINTVCRMKEDNIKINSLIARVNTKQTVQISDCSNLLNQLGRIHRELDKCLDRLHCVATETIYYETDFIKSMINRWSCEGKIFEAIERSSRSYSVYCLKNLMKSIEDQVRKICCHWKPELSNEHWMKMKEVEDNVLNYAIMGKLVSATDDNMKGYDERFRKKMESNSKMVEQLMKSFPEKDLFAFDNAWNEDLLYSLNYNNIDLFYRLVLRGNIIRCNIYPELVPKYLAWLKGEDVKENDVRERCSSGSRNKLTESEEESLKTILEMLAKGSWRASTTEEKVRALIEVLFGAKPEQLDESDYENSLEFRNFFIKGRGSKNFSRLYISAANVVGYLMDCGYLPNSPKQLSRSLFGNELCDNNINKGKKNNRSETFEKLIPFIDKYRKRIIEDAD